MSTHRVIIPRRLSLPPSVARGFTMVELMVVVAITGILAAVAIPNYSGYMASRMIKDQTSAFSRSINLARSEAVKRGRVVSMCRSADPEAAAPVCGANGGDWSTGWIVFVDNNSNGAIDQGDTVVRVQPGWTNSGTISNGGAGNPLRFRPTGIGTGLGQSFTFKPKVEGSTKERKLTLSMTGRWRPNDTP